MRRLCGLERLAGLQGFAGLERLGGLERFRCLRRLGAPRGSASGLPTGWGWGSPTARGSAGTDGEGDGDGRVGLGDGDRSDDSSADAPDHGRSPDSDPEHRDDQHERECLGARRERPATPERHPPRITDRGSREADPPAPEGAPERDRRLRNGLALDGCHHPIGEVGGR